MTGTPDRGDSAEGVSEKLSDDIARLSDELDAIEVLEDMLGAKVCHLASRGDRAIGIESDMVLILRLRFVDKVFSKWVVLRLQFLMID